MKAQKTNRQVHWTLARKPDSRACYRVNIHFHTDSHRFGHLEEDGFSPPHISQSILLKEIHVRLFLLSLSFFCHLTWIYEPDDVLEWPQDGLLFFTIWHSFLQLFSKKATCGPRMKVTMVRLKVYSESCWGFMQKMCVNCVPCSVPLSLAGSLNNRAASFSFSPPCSLGGCLLACQCHATTKMSWEATTH